VKFKQKKCNICSLKLILKQLNIMKNLLLILSSFLLMTWSQTVKAQAFTFTAGQLTYNQNFDVMGATGTTYPTGWTGVRYAGTGTIGAVLTPVVGDGSGNSGAVYNAGTTGAGERALGTLASGSTVPRMGASFLNSTGSNISQVSLAGVMEQWRTGSNSTGSEVCAFEYSTDATDLLTGTWTAATTFDLVEKITSSAASAALDGNLPDNQTAITATLIGLVWPSGTTLWIRWSDVNDTGNDGLYSIDNLVMTVSGTATPVISVTAPAAGNQWKQGSSHNITWVASNTNANVKIEFSDNASAGTPTWSTLNPSVAASAGTWTWNIPAGQALSSDCKIRITDIPQTAQGLSGTFSIVPPPPTVANIAALRAGVSGQEYTLTGQAILTFQQTFRNQKFIQDATGAILIDDAPGVITTTYNVGDGITGITGSLLQYSNGMLEFVPTANPGAATSTGNVITPEVVTLANFNANFENYESELVRITNCTFADAGTNFANGVIYAITDLASTPGSFRTTFYDVDYIGTPIPAGMQDVIGIANSTTTSNALITSRNLADIIPSAPTEAINVTSPNGGEFWQQGSTHTITWSSTNFTGNVKIELVGTNPSVIVASVANTGSYTWNISPTQTIATDYKVKISDAADGNPSDMSNSTFAIVAPYTVPNLVITEIMYNSPGNDEEWIEIYNSEATTVDMTGFYILDDDPAHITNPITLPANSTIAAGGRFTVELATAGAFPFVPNYDGSGKFSLGNTTDQVKLYHRYGQLIDSVKYSDSSPWPTGPDGGGSSLTFCDPTQDNSVATYWSASTEPYLTLQGTTIQATPGSGCYVSSDNIMITEIMYNPPDGGNDTIEFIELYNKGSVNVNIKDWYFANGVTYTFPDYTMAPNSYYVVARDSVSMHHTFGITCSQWTAGFLDDSGVPIILSDAIGQIKDSVYYLPTAPWPTTPNNGGPSLTFCNTALDNSLGENWSASTNQIAVNGVGQPIYASPGTSCISGANLVITEIMYNPPETGTDSLEFIELYNAGNSVNLEGFYFSAGVDFTFPSVTMANGEYLLVAYNASAIQNTFGKTALQWTSGGLNNTGEAITLKDNYGITIDDVTYADASPWDSLADGHGPSLTLCDPSSNNAVAINWKASSEFAAVNAAGDTIFATPLGGCVNPPTVANFEADPTVLNAGYSVQFHDLSTNNPTAWEWTLPGGTPATSTLQNPYILYSTIGVYSVTLKATNAYGNSTLTKTDYIHVGDVGITVLPSKLAVYPNPTHGKLFITNPSKETQEIEVFSATGKLVNSAASGDDIISLDISGQTEGLYLVRITSKTDLKSQVIKVILK